MSAKSVSSSTRDSFNLLVFRPRASATDIGSPPSATSVPSISMDSSNGTKVLSTVVSSYGTKVGSDVSIGCSLILLLSWTGIRAAKFDPEEEEEVDGSLDGMSFAFLLGRCTTLLSLGGDNERGVSSALLSFLHTLFIPLESFTAVVLMLSATGL